MLTMAPADEQPIIVMVKRNYACCCCECKYDIPAGLTVLEEDCGKSTGVMRPGAHWCYCYNKRVACMLTKAIVNYNAPVNKIMFEIAYLISDNCIGSQLPHKGQCLHQCRSVLHV